MVETIIKIQKSKFRTFFLFFTIYAMIFNFDYFYHFEEEEKNSQVVQATLLAVLRPGNRDFSTDCGIC